ncbi:hypothetical protein DV737_g2822, partial [Chaetothyriales sp. CBS 132003]
MSPTVLCRPFWRTLGLVVARGMEKESPGIDQLCDLLGMRLSGLMLLVEEYALPYLVLHRRLSIIEQFAAAHGSSTSAFDICTSPRNLAGILSFLLAQGFQDAEQKIMNLLLDVSTDFNSGDLAGWLAHVPIEVTCFSLKSIGDTGESKSSRVYQALQLVAQLDSRKPGIHSSSSRRNDVMGSFLENNALGIVSHFTVSLNDLEAKEPKLEKRRSIIALGEVVKIGKSRILGALPQICACLRNALEDKDLCDAAFSAWAMVMSSLHADDLDTLVDQTFAIVVKHWDKFNTITQQRAYDLIAELLEKHSEWIRESFMTFPSLASIPVMAKFEVEIGALKRQMDERHQLIAFLSRLEDENEIVVEQALTELVPVLHLKQDFLHRSILLEQPDELVSDLTRALLDSCVRFQANHEIGRLRSKDEELARLQDIYAQIDEPDGIEGISAQMHIVDIQGRVLEHKKAGRWTAVQGWYQVQLAEHPDDMDLQKNLMECLKESGQHDLLLDRYQAMESLSVTATAQLKPYAVEAAWTTMRWPELDNLLESGGDDDFAMNLGRMFSLLTKGEADEIGVLLEEMFKSTASELTPNSITTLQNCHETLFRLHILEDVRLLKGADPNDRPSNLSVTRNRLEVIGSNVRDKQIALSVQRAVMSLRKDVFQNNDIASSWLQSARLARKARDSAQAFDAVLKASALGDKSAAIEEAKLFWQDGEHRKAIQTLEGAIDSGAFVAHDYVAEDANAPLTTEQQKNQNEMTAKAYLLLGKWLDQAGQTQSDVIKNTFRKSTENFRRWEKGWYYLGRHYNKLLDSERTMPLDKQSQTYLSGEMTKLAIENYLRSLINGTKYVFQTLPKILTLWFELVANLESPPDPRKGSEKFQVHNAAQRKRVVEETNNYIKKYIDRIQASVLYTILPQIMARICHTNPSVYEILANIVVKVVRAFPNQALWALLAVTQSQSKDRASRGMEIVTKIVDAPKKSSGLAMPTADLRAFILSSRRFSDELLRVSEFPIEGKVSHISLSRKLKFNPRIAPSKLVVPSENSLIPSIPTSYDSAYLKSFRAFPKEPITIAEFLDEALVLASLQKPRKLSIRGSDGQIYGVLAKPKDDMRKDQRLMEFNTMINRFLKRDVEASKRRLYIRTYAVIPLNEECGLIEWVNNLKTFRDIILKLYKDKSIAPNYGEIRKLLDESCSGPREKASIFTTSVLKMFPPVFHEWFVESFPEPTAWFNARLRYTRACAVMSIVGHVLGLGDRHGENVLLEEDNGNLMHVDFNCLFDKGLTFEKPEYVPFRLTHNMVDAMGAYGYEGPFRRSSEITLQLLRSNEDALMTILETFMHDPTTDFLEKERRKKKSVPGVPNTPLEVLESVRGKK